MAFEVSDLNAFVQKMKERAVSFITEAFNMPVCRMAVTEDPDHNHITIHKRHTCGCCRFVNRDRSYLPLLLLTIAGRGGGNQRL